MENVKIGPTAPMLRLNQQERDVIGRSLRFHAAELMKGVGRDRMVKAEAILKRARIIEGKQ